MAGFYAYEETIVEGAQQIALSRAQAHHLMRVLRARKGDMVTVFDGSGRYATGCIDDRGSQVCVQVEAWNQVERASFRLELAAAMLKGKSMDTLMRDATELSVCAVIPLNTKHTEVRLSGKEVLKKLEGWREQMVAAAKQCGNLLLPALSEPRSLDDLMGSADENTLMLVGSLEADAPLMSAVLESHREMLAQALEPVVRLLIGPEGDFSKDEYALLRARGVLPVRLGRQVLRAPTAAVYALGVADQFLEQIRG